MTPKIKKTPLIIADIREKNSMVLAEILNIGEVELRIEHLDIGDYLVGSIAIERKTVSDLISSMINKRLISQLENLKKYKKRILIIEGDLQETISQNTNISKALRGLILSLLTKHLVPVLQTLNPEETAYYLVMLAKRELKPVSEISLHSKIPRSLKQQKLYILEAFPSIGPKTAKRLLDKFQSLKRIFNASEEELSQILKSKTKNFKQLLD